MTFRRGLLILVLAMAAAVLTWVLTGADDGLAGKFRGQTCFQYDVTVESYKICGTPTEIENQQRDRGRKMAESAVGVLEDPVSSCVARSVAQAEMHGWPDRYRDAYAEGCRSLP